MSAAAPVARSPRPSTGETETRDWAVHGVELRQQGSTLTLAGYASVFDAPYDIYGGPPMGWSETIDPSAFDKTLREKPDVQLLINHAGMPLARTKSGTLRLSADRVGLKVAADLDPSDPDVASLRPKMARADLDEMSFGFRVLRQEWDEDYEKRRLLEISLHRGDVSVVNYGANPATSATLRALAEIGRVAPAALLSELRREGAGDPTRLIDAALEVLTAAQGQTGSGGAGVTLSEARSVLDALDDRPVARPRRSDARQNGGGLSLSEARAQVDALGRRR